VRGLGVAADAYWEVRTMRTPFNASQSKASGLTIASFGIVSRFIWGVNACFISYSVKKRRPHKGFRQPGS